MTVSGAGIGRQSEAAGSSRGRPRPAGLPAEWDPDLYLLMNPDVAALVEAGTVENAAAHWLAQGWADEEAGRRPTVDGDEHYTHDNMQDRPPSKAELAAFDPEWYLANSPDVQAAAPEHDAVDHWMRHGRFEGRPFFLGSRAAHRRTRLRDMMARPFGVNFYAPFSARSGLGTAARGYLRALRAMRVPVQLCNLNYDRHPSFLAARDYDRVPRYRVNLIQANADTLQRIVSHFRLEQFDDAYTIGIWAWEMNILRPDWFESFSMLDEVWTLSDFNTAAVAAVAPVPVHTMNCAIVPCQPKGPFDRTYFGLPQGFQFLTVFDVGSSMDRKNPYGVVDAFRSSFGERGDVSLVLKFHSGRSDPAGVRRLMQHVRGWPNVIVRSEKLSGEEMLGLQGCSDCLVSAHRSEGFGLNIAEFMGMGKPVIATGYGGNMDFTTDANSYLIGYGIRPVASASGPYFPGYLWAEPDQADLARLMRQVTEQPDQARQVGQAAEATVRDRLSPEAVGQRMLARLDELGLRQDVPPFVTLLGGSAGLAMPPPPATMEISDPRQQEAQPTISVVVPVYDVAPEWLVRCIESVRSQTYQRWELCLCDDSSTDPATIGALRGYQGLDPRIRIMRLPRNSGIAAASNAAVLMATGTHLLMLDNDDELTSDALHHVAMAVVNDPGIDVIYSDEDKLDAKGRAVDHYFKPDWSPEHLESVMYTLHPLTVRTSLFLEVGGFRPEYTGSQDYDLMLRLSRRTDRIHHIPRILYHWRMIAGSASAEVDAKPAALDAGRRALQDHIAIKYGPDRATAEPGLLPGLHRVRHRIAGDPAVTILIPTNNGRIELPGRKPFTMVDNLVTSIAEHTSYRNYRTVVMDHRNSSAEQLALYKRLGVVLGHYDGPTKPFNYSEKMNFGLSRIETEHVVLMNDDMEVFDEEWLSSLLEFSQNPEVGACGGKLLHADGTIQHAGVVLGPHGGASHIYHGFPGDFVGYNAFTHVIRNYSALTAACLATRRSVIAEIGGFDRRLAIDYNDMDLCLRMRQIGYRIVYTPYSRACHFESASAKRTTQDPEEVALFRSRWNGVVENDPYYNPNLSQTRHDFARR